MHEANFTDQIVDAILEGLKPYPGKSPKEVHVAVGEMLHLVPESVRMHYKLRTLETCLEGAELVLEQTPVRIRCKACGSTGGVDDHHLLMCSFCDSMDVELISGNEITIGSIQLE